MLPRRALLIVSAFLLVAVTTRTAGAQASPGTARPGQRGGDVHGRIVSAVNGAPVRSATIEVTGVADSLVVVARVAARPDGSFRAAGLAPGSYRVRVRALGFAPTRTPVFTITAAAASIDLGTLSLPSAAVELERLTVREARRAVELAPDRTTYAVRDMPTTRGGSAVDVLRTVPSVDVDMDNTISLRGDAGVIVQISGRRSAMNPAQLGNFLSQLPAAMVEKVEIIPNPSARENPEGSSGIINIVLKQKADAGSSGGLTAAEGTTGRTDVGANMGYQHEPVTYFGSYGYSRDSRPRSESLFRDNLYATPLTFLDQRGSRTQIPKVHTLTSAMTWSLGRHDELSADLLYSTRVEDETSNLLYRDLDAQRRLTGLRDRSSTTINSEDGFESTLEYKHAFAKEDHELTTELRFARASEGGPSEYTSRVLSLAGAPVGLSSRESIAPMERPDERGAKLGYVLPLREHLQLSAGYSGTWQTFRTTLDTRVFDASLGTFAIDPERTTAFTFDQAVNAAYGIVTGSAGNVNMQAGLRVERAGTQFRRTGTGAGFDNHYGSAFPSALASYNVDDATQVKLSFSTRIRRPDEPDQLDPTPHYQDPLNLSRGNPTLKPEYIRAFELGFQRSTGPTTLQVTPFYRHTIDAVRRIRSIDAAGVTTSTFANIATTDNYGTDVTLALHGGPLTGFVGASAYRQQSDASNVSALLSARTFGWSARTNASLRVSSTFDVQTILSYRARTTVEQGTNFAQTRVSLAARQKLLRDRVSLTLRITDPFSTEREGSTTIDPRFTQVSHRARQARGALLNVTWNFGRPPKDKPIVNEDPTGAPGM
jgi:outer membrane cobalamin receptor